MTGRVIIADAREGLAGLPDESVHLVVCSPPYYGHRDYGEPGACDAVFGGDPTCAHVFTETAAYRDSPRRRGDEGVGYHDAATTRAQRWYASAACGCGAWLGQLGQEPTPEGYVAHLVEVLRACARVLRRDGTLWLVLGDSYATQTNGPSLAGSTLEGSLAPHAQVRQARAQRSAGIPRGYKHKDLIGIPWMAAFALRADGWYLRSEVTWVKTAPMPESTRDRPTMATEKVFILAKQRHYFYDWLAVAEPFADKRQGRDGSRRLSERNRGGRRGGLTKPNGIDPSGNGGRNWRNYLLLGPEPNDLPHYAPYPTAIPRQAILAGTSAGGVCPTCGAPYRRQSARSRATHPTGADPTATTGRRGLDRPRPGDSDRYILAISQPELAGRLRAAAVGREPEMRALFGSKWAHWIRTDAIGARVPTRTDAAQLEALLGIRIPFDGQAGQFRPACRCAASGPPIAATVCDPFGGTGTTAVAAERAGRDWILIDIDPANEPLMRARTAQRGLPILEGQRYASDPEWAGGSGDCRAAAASVQGALYLGGDDGESDLLLVNGADSGPGDPAAQ